MWGETLHIGGKPFPHVSPVTLLSNCADLVLIVLRGGCITGDWGARVFICKPSGFTNHEQGFFFFFKGTGFGF